MPAPHKFELQAYPVEMHLIDVIFDHQSRASSTLEHPGPPPVDEGKETGSGGSNETGKVKGKKNTGGQGDKDVERHNKEMEERYDKKGKNDVDEKAGKGYWKEVYESGRVVEMHAECKLSTSFKLWSP
ncbi:hypothetical protein BDD12DRAFT_804075 [Trichophaea hybrida]|nr:hypothetical protein BDD12DRAFT_804075 [Trichophaea hybrida]